MYSGGTGGLVTRLGLLRTGNLIEIETMKFG